MKDFKRTLQAELKQEVPFTDEVKRRVLQPKPKKRTVHWQVGFVAILFVSLLAAVVVMQLPPKQLAASPTLLPIVKDVSNVEVIDPAYAEFLGEQWTLHFLPMIVDRNAALSYGDYVAYYQDGQLVASTVFGLEKDRVEMNEGQILVNGRPLKMHGLGEKIAYEDRNDAFKNPYLIRTRATIAGDFLNETVQANGQELVIYKVTENNDNALLKINKDQVVGKIVGFKHFDIAFGLDEQEQRAFELFKADYNLAHLQHVSPVAIAKMYLLSDAVLDFKTYEALFTTNINSETETVRRYYEKTKPIRLGMYTKETAALTIAYLFNGMEQATFEQESETRGLVKYQSIHGEETGLYMEKNEQGIWQPAFSHIYY